MDRVGPASLRAQHVAIPQRMGMALTYAAGIRPFRSSESRAKMILTHPTLRRLAQRATERRERTRPEPRPASNMIGGDGAMARPLKDRRRMQALPRACGSGSSPSAPTCSRSMPRWRGRAKRSRPKTRCARKVPKCSNGRSHDTQVNSKVVRSPRWPRATRRRLRMEQREKVAVHMSEILPEPMQARRGRRWAASA
jgi:hypothetical protein